MRTERVKLKAKRYSNQQKGEAIERYIGLGESVDIIAREIGCPPNSIQRWITVYYLGRRFENRGKYERETITRQSAV